MATATATKPSLTIKRRFKAPPAKVYAAWTDPEKVKGWMGPGEVKAKSAESDLRVGGRYHWVMVAPSGQELDVRGVYREIVPGSRLVYTECYENPQAGNPEWLTTITFEDVEGGTQLTHAILHRSREVRDGHLQAGMKEGAIQTLNRLDTEASRMLEVAA